MSEFRFVHAADLHLDARFVGLGRASPAVAEVLRDASLGAFDALVETTLDCGAAFLVLAGDLYDGADRGLRAQTRFLRGLERLSASGVRVFVAHGNHDPLDGRSAIDAWPEGVHVFGSDAVESVSVRREGTDLAVVHGISYAQREARENLVERFAREESSNAFQIGVLHAQVDHHRESSPYSPATVDDLIEIGLDYWALGHVHGFSVLRERAPTIVYPGTPQGRSLRPSECGPKGVVVVDVRDGSVAGLEFVPLDRARFERLRVATDELGDVAALRTALVRAAQLAQADAGRRALVVRAELSGRGECLRALRRSVDREALLDELREDAAGAEPLLWWDDVRLSANDRDRRHRFDTAGPLARELGRLVRELEDDPARLAEFVEDSCAALANSRTGRRSRASVSPSALPSLLRSASELLLERVARESRR